MVQSKITAFESTCHKTNLWIQEVKREACWDDTQRAYHALVAVLHAIRDQLEVAEVADFSAQLPMLLRGAYYEGWQPARKTEKVRTEEGFLEIIYRAFPNDLEIDAEHVFLSVLNVITRHVSAGEMSDIKSTLPAKVRELWPVLDH